MISKRLKDRPGLHLALGGGSARGLAHLGVLKVIEEHKLPIASICGASMGAMIGAAYALTPNAEALIAHFLEHVRSKQFNQTRYAFLKKVAKSEKVSKTDFSKRFMQGWLVGKSFTQGSFVPYAEYAAEISAIIPNQSFAATKIPFYAVAVDLNLAREVVFNQGLLRSAVMASAAIPGVLPAVRSGETVYVDGGWANKVPINPLLAFGAERVLAINVSQAEIPEANLNRGTTLLTLANLAAQIHLNQIQMESAALIWEPDTHGLDLMGFEKVEEAVEVGMAFASSRVDEAKALLEPPARSRWWQTLPGFNPVPAVAPPHFYNSFDVRGIWDVEQVDRDT